MNPSTGEEAIGLTTHRQAGVCGSAIINNHTILIVNLHELAEKGRPDLYAAQAKHIRIDS